MISKKTIESLVSEYSCKVFLPANEKDVIAAETAIGSFPKVLKNLYAITNGIEADTFRILPVFDANSIKFTWDSINRANNANNTKFSLNQELLNKFIIFAEIGALHCAFIDKNDEKIWFEDDEGYHQTDLQLEEFITLCLKES